MSEEQQQSALPKYRDVKFIHRHLPSYRALHADGAWITLATDEIIHMNVFSEQPLIPNTLVLNVNPQTGIYTGNHSVSDQDPIFALVTRDLQADVVMTLEAAIAFRDNLNTFIEMGLNQRKSKIQAQIKKAEKPISE